MTELPNLEERRAFFLLLRELGVRRYCGAAQYGMEEVEFFPPEAPVAAPDLSPDLSKSMGLGAEEKCPCGHAFTSHNGAGFCLEGCEAALCEVKQPPPA